MRSLAALCESDATREAQVGVGLLVGRTVELARLEEALAACQAGQRSGLVTVIGEPGAGKSRLLAEFQERFGGEVRVARGRCPSYGDGITYWPIVHVLRDLTGLRGDEEPIAIAAALDRVLVGAEDGADVAGALLPLLGGGGTPSEAETVAWAVGRALEHVAADRGLVVAIDDLHWAEPTLLDLLDGLSVELTDRPVLVIGTARPELAERRPTWPETAKNHDVVELAALTAAEVRARLADLLGGEPAADVVELVVERSGGNALFVGEIAAHLSETGAHGAAEELPPTVGVLLTARLHRLPDAERRLLERVSVVGLEFTRSDALALGDADDGLLRSLVDRGLLHSVAADPETWAFWHILGRDAAYDLLPKARRASLHERFASHVGAGTDGGSERLAFIAHHLATAASCRRDLAPGDAETVALVDRAVVALRAAADDARERDDLGAAIRLLRRALDLPPAALAVRRDLLAVLMNCLLDEDRPAELSPAYDELEAATSGDPDVTDLELSHLRCQRLMGRLLDAPADLMVQLDPAGADLTSKARACGDTVRLGAGLRARAQGLLLQWSYGQIYELYEPLATSGDVHAERFADVTKATAIMEGPFSLRLLEEHVARISVDSAPSPRHRYRLEVMRLAAVAAVQGADRDAGALAELRALSQHPYAAETFNAVHFGYGAVLAGDVDGAITVLGGLCEWFLERDDPWAWAYISLWRSAHRLGRGDEPDAIEVEVNEAYRYIEDVMEVTSTYAWICRALIAAARGDEAAKQHLEIALRLVDTTEATLLRAQVRDWGAQVAAAAGDTATERRLLEEALDLYRLKELGAQTRWTERRLATL